MVVFMVGGITYEETLAVHNINKTVPGIRIVLAGTTIHNCKRFVDIIQGFQWSTTYGSIK